MSLTELMSGANLDGYAQISLLLFCSPSRSSCGASSPRFTGSTRDARMPLDDEHPQTPRTRGE
jgi:hypothetical protein